MIQLMAPVNCRNCASNFPPLLAHNIVSFIHTTNTLVIIRGFSPDSKDGTNINKENSWKKEE